MISTVISQTESLVKQAHSLIKDRVKPGEIVIDATVGNGLDTLFLVDLVQPGGNVFGFDIQQAALELARKRLEHHPSFLLLNLIRASHADMHRYIPPEYRGKISAIMFNLGYLPGGDKNIITETHSTLCALSCAASLLGKGGILSVLAYPGHDGGKLESEAVESWCRRLDPEKFFITLHQNRPGNPSAPKLFMVNRIA